MSIHRLIYRCLCLMLLLVACSNALLAAEIVSRPNIVLIVADDLGYNDLSCMGQKDFKTPNIDKMAQQGIKFTQFYAGCTVCAPSRACLLTGQHTGHVFQRYNGNVQFREDPLDMTIATRLRQAGYATAMIGKSGLSCNSDDGGLPNRKGFDHFVGFTSHGAAHRYFPTKLWKNQETLFYPDNHSKEGDVYSGEVFLNESLAWIESNHEGSFFLHMALQQPHADLQVPASFREKYIGKYDETPHQDGHYRAELHPKATFVGMIDYLDDTVGQVLAKLQALQIAEKTLVIFTSDNGPHFEGGHHPEALNSNGALRGGKRDLYEGGIRVPMIAWWPNTIEAERSSDLISAQWDFPATACELAGIPIPQESDGVSLVPTLLGSGQQSQHDYLYWEFYERGGKQAVRAGNWKAVRLNVSKDRNGPIELYDLANDIGESTNVADQFPEVIQRMAGLLAEAHTPLESLSFETGPTKKSPSARVGKRLSLEGVIDRSKWNVVQFSSESKHNGRTIDCILDGDPTTHWHSRFDRDPAVFPHSFVIDLQESVEVSGVRFLSRQDGTQNGVFCDVAIEFSETQDFQSTSVQATLAASRDEQQVDVKGRGRYVKVTVLSEANGGNYASLAEFNLVEGNRPTP